MPPLARVVGLYCGQGMAHLVEIYNDGDGKKGVADFLALVDFGGDEQFAGDALHYVYAKLKAQSDAGRPARLDLVVISHQDKDHLNLLKYLAVAIKDLNVQAGQVFLGGLEWGLGNKAIVTNFLTAVKAPAWAWSTPKLSNYEGVSSREGLGALAQFSGFYFRVLVSHLPVPGASDRRNASSTVLVIENGTRSVVLPGDATWQTMNYVNDLYAGWAGKPLVPAVSALEVPHHGALRTAVHNYDAKKNFGDFDLGIITTFRQNLEALRIFASAGNPQKHGHPVKQVLDLFKPHVQVVEDHPYVAFVFDPANGTKKDAFAEFTTVDAIFTTLIGISPGPVWKNIVVYMGGATAAVSNQHTLRELLVMDGVEPPPGMGTTPVSGTDTPARPAPPPPVHAPAPTAAERAAAPAAPESA